MASQIFNEKCPNELLFTLLDEICTKNENQYTFNNSSFKKGIFNESIQQFIEDLKPYYHHTKQLYITRKINYNNFITILRQICNFNKITYTSKMKYDKSTYEIVYFIQQTE